MVIIRQALDPQAPPAPETRRIPLVAGRRQLAKRRWRARALDGTEFGFDLTAPLAAGSVIHRTAGSEYFLQPDPEPVIEIPWRDRAQAALIGWHIGNLHQPVEVLPDRFRTADDPAIRQLLAQHAWPGHPATAAFHPLAAMTSPHPA